MSEAQMGQWLAVGQQHLQAHRYSEALTVYEQATHGNDGIVFPMLTCYQ